MRIEKNLQKQRLWVCFENSLSRIHLILLYGGLVFSFCPENLTETYFPKTEIIKIEKLYIILNNPVTVNYGVEVQTVRYAIGRCSRAKKSILLNKL